MDVVHDNRRAMCERTAAKKLDGLVSHRAGGDTMRLQMLPPAAEAAKSFQTVNRQFAVNVRAQSNLPAGRSVDVRTTFRFEHKIPPRARNCIESCQPSRSHNEYVSGRTNRCPDLLAPTRVRPDEAEPD